MIQFQKKLNIDIQFYVSRVYFFFFSWKSGLLNSVPLVALNSLFFLFPQVSMPPSSCLTFMSYTSIQHIPGEKRLQ